MKNGKELNDEKRNENDGRDDDLYLNVREPFDCTFFSSYNLS